MTRRVLWWSVGLVLLAGALAVWWLTRPLPILTVTTWPGAYGRAEAIAFLRPFADQERVDVRIAQYDGGLDHLRDEVRRRQYDWDAIDFELDDAVTACHEGLLEPIGPNDLPPGTDGTPAKRDFLPNAIGPCWMGAVVFSQVIAFARQPAGRAAPTSAKDFFDVAKFPGPRALRGSSPKFNLELALLADGVPANEVYATLTTSTGIARALHKLDTIRPEIRWWSNAQEPISMLNDGRAVMATALNGDVFDAQNRDEPVGILWDHQLYELDVLGVPRGDPRANLALRFVRFATGTAPLAHVSSWLPYGPARRSSLNGVRTNPELHIQMLGRLPTAPGNFQTAFAIDDEWWRLHGASLTERWLAWRGPAP
jgi:putative spermidine/putrescine transport system substrate-binding protein